MREKTLPSTHIPPLPKLYRHGAIHLLKIRKLIGTREKSAIRGHTPPVALFSGGHTPPHNFSAWSKEEEGGRKNDSRGPSTPPPVIKSHRPVPIRHPTPVWDQKFENLWDHDPMLPSRRAIWVLGRAIWVLGRALWDRSHR